MSPASIGIFGRVLLLLAVLLGLTPMMSCRDGFGGMCLCRRGRHVTTRPFKRAQTERTTELLNRIDLNLPCTFSALPSGGGQNEIVRRKNLLHRKALRFTPADWECSPIG